MRGFRSSLLLAFCLAAILRVEGADSIPPEIFAADSASVVTLTAYSADGTKLGQEAGFVIAKPGIVATCFHVIADAASVEVQSADQTTHAAAAVILSDPDSDLALLKVDALAAQPLKLGSPEALHLDAPVAVIGSRFRVGTFLSQGVINKLFSPVGELNKFEFSAPVSPGASGHPLVSTDTGEVLGMTVYRVKTGQKNFYAVPARIIAYRLQSVDQTPERALDDLTPEVKRALSEAREFRNVVERECTETSAAMINHEIQEAIDGAFWVNSHHMAVFRIYEGAAYKILYNLGDQSATASSALKAALEKAAAIQDGPNAPQEKSAILRSAFESLFGIQGLRH
jgi:S1-C subfamily serine protease